MRLPLNPEESTRQSEDFVQRTLENEEKWRRRTEMAAA